MHSVRQRREIKWRESDAFFIAEIFINSGMSGTMGSAQRQLAFKKRPTRYTQSTLKVKSPDGEIPINLKSTVLVLYLYQRLTSLASKTDSYLLMMHTVAELMCLYNKQQLLLTPFEQRI